MPLCKISTDQAGKTAFFISGISLCAQSAIFAYQFGNIMAESPINKMRNQFNQDSQRAKETHLEVMKALSEAKAQIEKTQNHLMSALTIAQKRNKIRKRNWIIIKTWRVL